MLLGLRAYRPLARLAHRVLPLWRGERLGDALAGRRGATQRWLDWAATVAGDRPRVWIHASSVGEWLAARPVARRLAAAHPDLNIALTYSSPSLARWPVLEDVDRADYIPPDEPGPMTAVFDALAPGLVLVSRGDLWPELLAAAQRRGAFLAVIGGVISPRSRRLAWPVRSLLRELYRDVRYVGAVSPDDAERFIHLGVPASAVEVTGDPRHDQVLERIPDLAAIAPVLSWAAGREVLIAGSTHPSDDGAVLGAFATVRNGYPRAALVMAPHEPAPETTHHLARQVSRLGLQAAAWPGAVDLSAADAVIVESRGSLADLYACACAAYVGGGFAPAGVHAVSEPAAYGIPIALGPQWSRSADARLLVTRGGAVTLAADHAAAQLAAVWMGWLRDPAARDGAGLRARRTLEGGAAARTAARLLTELGRCSLRRSPNAAPPAPP